MSCHHRRLRVLMFLFIFEYQFPKRLPSGTKDQLQQLNTQTNVDDASDILAKRVQNESSFTNIHERFTSFYVWEI